MSQIFFSTKDIGLEYCVIECDLYVGRLLHDTVEKLIDEAKQDSFIRADCDKFDWKW